MAEGSDISPAVSWRIVSNALIDLGSIPISRLVGGNPDGRSQNELDHADTRLEWTLALVHAATALRPEEAFGLKWHDIDWANGPIKICRGWSKGKETPGKNAGSMTEVVTHTALAQALLAWRRETVYSRDHDWVFASKKSNG